jgi:16S rRNA (cytidine1402-2'-O)-methyltransferase
LEQAGAPQAGTLYVVATPIGNLEDISERALRVLREADLVLAEDTRRLRKLLAARGISASVQSYHGDSAPARRERVLAELAAGRSVALVADAGTPAVSDPGAELVAAAAEGGARIVSIPGPSAVTAGLSGSGLPGEAFEFAGYAPRQSGERREFLRRLALSPVTSVFFETPHRITECLRDLAEVAGQEQQVVVCRELTKLHEEILPTTVGEALARFESEQPRGEFTLLLPPGQATEPAGPPDEALREAGARLLELGVGTRDAAGVLATLTGRARREMYQLLLQLREDG